MNQPPSRAFCNYHVTITMKHSPLRCTLTDIIMKDQEVIFLRAWKQPLKRYMYINTIEYDEKGSFHGSKYTRSMVSQPYKYICNMYNCASLCICVHVNDEISCTQKLEVNWVQTGSPEQGLEEYETVQTILCPHKIGH